MARKTTQVFLTTQEDIEKINEDNKELIEDFINYLETTDHSPASIKVYKSNLNIFFVYLSKNCRNKDFRDIKKRDIMNFQNYLIKNDLSPARIRTLRSSISSLANFCMNILDEEEKWEGFVNIVNKIPAPTLTPKREKTIMSDEDIEILLKKLIGLKKYQIALFVAMGAFSGARKAEVLQYKRNFFKEESVRNGLYITPEIRTKGKGVAGKKLKKYCIKSKIDKYLKLIDEFREENSINLDELFVVKRNGEWKPANISTVDSWMRICTKLINKDCYFHNFRHYFVSMLLREQIPINVVKDIVGHNDSSTTEIYDDNDKEDGFLKYFSEEGIVKIESKSLSDI